MLILLMLSMLLVVIFVATFVIRALGCIGGLIFWICGIIGVILFLLLLF